MPNEEIEIITSDHLLSDFDHHFKVFAGPGAGKTYWLINNIRNILKNSTKLFASSKVACITYTNVAVDEIQTRLDMAGDRVEVSTIHSFLYNCLVKPYVHLLKNENGNYLVNIERLDGHDDHIPSVGRILGNGQMSSVIFKNKIKNDELHDVLASLEWYLNGDDMILQPRNEWQRKRFKKLMDLNLFYAYKAMFWDDGIIHHEDVLFFSYEILKQFPLLRSFIAAKYPYIFIDEFQDTHPVQTKILKWISEAGSIIGVIGDPAQSIFQFQGASRTDFLEFKLPGQKNYAIMYNRRSTRNIINLLNHVRGTDEVVQECYRDIDGSEVCVIIDKSTEGIIKKFNAERECLGLNGDSCIVTRRNDAVTMLKSCVGNCNVSVWSDFLEVDSKRQRFIEIILTAQEYANNSMYETAVKEVMKIFKTDKNGELKDPFTSCSFEIKNLFKRSIAVALLVYLTSNRDENLKKNVLTFYNDLITFFNGMGITLKKVSSGAFKTFAQVSNVIDLVLGLKLGEEKKSTIRTIHKSKGAEFQSVLVYFEDNEDIKHLLNPDVKSADDDCRLYYVALSRAKDFLCIATDELSQMTIEDLKRLKMRLIE
ncbi:ATP-dependent helicase [Acetivibrio mesophilus]|uniref:DNA 3'-5' helicase n=1 Tax=Acetivibrio mesophilus TaxID=2487273 RepID=A0A4Q0I5R9_9FIRM|nr:ATP-dependent helicase [Acetivibrio mesophilus]RXE59650.1 ATP-dependent helicase [Acetivibrio mesophilus]